MNVLVKKIMEDIEEYTQENKANFDDVLFRVIDTLVVISGLRKVEPIIIKNKEETNENISKS